MSLHWLIIEEILVPLFRLSWGFVCGVAACMVLEVLVLRRYVGGDKALQAALVEVQGLLLTKPSNDTAQQKLNDHSKIPGESTDSLATHFEKTYGPGILSRLAFPFLCVEQVTSFCLPFLQSNDIGGKAEDMTLDDKKKMKSPAMKKEYPKCHSDYIPRQRPVCGRIRIRFLG